MKTLKQHINEWKLTNDSIVKIEKIKPESYAELREIVLDRFIDMGWEDPRINLTDVDVSNITSFGDFYESMDADEKYNGWSGFGLFYGLEKVESIDVTGWNTKKVTKLRCLFDSCEDLKEIKGIENWDVSNVSDMGNAFLKCYNLEMLDLSKWNLKKVTTMARMFEGCYKLKVVRGIDNWKISRKLVDIRDMLNGCDKLAKPIWW